MKTEDLKAGWLIELKGVGLRVVMPVTYYDVETLALVHNLRDDVCQQLLTFDVFRGKTHAVLKVWGLPTNNKRCWLEISTEGRPLLWERPANE